MKKLFILLMEGAMLFSLAACGGKQTTQSSTEEISGTVTLKLAHNMDFVTIPDAVVAAAKALNERYAAEGKDLEIVIE